MARSIKDITPASDSIHSVFSLARTLHVFAQHKNFLKRRRKKVPQTFFQITTMANPSEGVPIRIPSIALSDVSVIAAQESYIGHEAMTTPRTFRDSLSRSAVVGNLNLGAEEDFIGMHRLRANTDSLRRPGVYTNRAYDEYIPCEDYQENQYEDLASIAAKQNAPRKKSNEIYEPAGRSPNVRRKQNALYETAVPAPQATLKVPPRSRNPTECSDDSVGSYRSFFIPSRPKQSCLHNLVLFLVLAFSLVAFSLVILQIFGIVETPCSCGAPKEGLLEIWCLFFKNGTLA